ncbi:MAG: preprotein translocase subunit YajC [Oscillospiraceae bacterium]|nr:preprotein translocase subunit YajC [Oscillospiraceae bacterium]
MESASSIIMIVAMLAIFYFLMIMPENKRKKKAEEMRNSLKKGERITTIGGLTGKIVQVNDSTVVFETSEDRVRIEIQKWGIQSTESSEQAAAQQPAGLFGKKKAEDSSAEAEKADKDEKKDFDPEVK